MSQAESDTAQQGPEASLDGFKKALGTYMRANKARKAKLGGVSYRNHLESEIASLEMQSTVVHGDETPQELSSDTTIDDIDVDAVKKPIDEVLELLPFRAFGAFKTEWNGSLAANHEYDRQKELEASWNVLQQSVVTLSAQHNLADDPAWPGPNVHEVGPTFEEISSTAEWIQAREPTFTVKNTSEQPIAEEEEKFQVWDYRRGAYVVMTDVMLHEAWTDPSSHMGCIEEGKDLVLRILTNRNKNQKCISCDSGARGQSASTKGQTLRGDGDGFLNKCCCPIDTALLEFWMYKISSADPRVPKRDPPGMPKGRAQYPASDFSLNPVSLQLIAATLEQASGLTVDSLFLDKHKRLETTILWAIKGLIGVASRKDERELFKRSLTHF